MFSSLDLGKAPCGLTRLLAYHRKGESLFQACRGGDLTVAEVHPVVRQTNLDPGTPRGYWAAGSGTLNPPPLVCDVFSSALVAAAMTLNQREGGSSVFRIDEFPDGVVSWTLGEAPGNQGSYSQSLAHAAGLRDEQPLTGYHVNVLPRSAFPADRMAFPIPGNYVTLRPVPVIDRVQLSGGDVRFLVKLLGDRLPWFDAETVRAAPFTGLFSLGGQLQAHWRDGDGLLRRRTPSDSDRRLAVRQSVAFSRRWLQVQCGLVRATLPPLSPGPLARAMTFIEENCTRQIFVIEIAAAAGLSISHLYAEFRRTLGCTPSDYTAERRLDIAEHLLRETDLSVAEISQRCGFAEQTNLTRSFRRLRGITPVSLRQTAVVLGEKS